MSWAGRRVVVTGAGGFIGSHLVERLARDGANVRALIRYYSRSDLGNLADLPAETLRRVEIVRGDVRDADAMRSLVRGSETVFHLAALIAIPYSYVNPREVIDVNVTGTLNVLAAVREVGASMIHTSTSEVYGTAQYTPIDERHPLQGQSPYSASKIAADRIAESFHRAFDVRVATLRPFNTFGPRQSARAIIPTIISQALTKDEIRLGSLTPVRDFTFVEDTVEGFLAIADSKEALGLDTNLGTGVAVTIAKLAEKIFEVTGRSPKIISDTDRLRPEKSEVFTLLADNANAAKRFGWRPRVSLEEGLRRTADWVAANLERFRPNEYTV